MTTSKNPQTIPSGVAGLDAILAGGIPGNRMYLLEGDPGSGKTTLAIQFLLEGVKNGESCLYIALSESAAELRAVAKSHKWDLSKITIYELPFQELSTSSPNTFFHVSEIELGATNQAILEEIKRVQPQRVVIDSLTELKLLAQDSMKFRRHIFSLKQFFLEQGATVLLLDDKTSSISDQEVKSIVHGIIKLEQLSPEYGAERRRLRILKLRGVPFRGGYHDFSIRTGGLIVFPRLVAAEHGSLGSEKQESIASGIVGVDQLTGGGIDRGSSTLLLGPAGAGKSTMALQYASAAAARGEKSFIFAFDEGLRTLINRTKGLGIEIEKYIENGLISIQQIDPAELSPGEFSHLVRDCVERSGAKIVIIDSLNGYLNAMPEERFLIIQMHELLSYLNQMSVVAFLVVAQHGLLGSTMETSVDISYLADNVILFRYFEVEGSVRQALSVLKRRSGAHERTIRELLFSPKGVAVSEPLKKFHGILTGVPQSVKNYPEHTL